MIKCMQVFIYVQIIVIFQFLYYRYKTIHCYSYILPLNGSLITYPKKTRERGEGENRRFPLQ